MVIDASISLELLCLGLLSSPLKLFLKYLIISYCELELPCSAVEH